jgi:hypothetical protein
MQSNLLVVVVVVMCSGDRCLIYGAIFFER